MTSAAQRARRAATETDPRWALVVARDTGADGTFYYSVATTGVYCRPSCSSRPARPENVRFHASRKDAEAAGFRPCKRCKPDQATIAERQNTLVTTACRMIESAETTPALRDLARAAGMSPYHFHRIFKSIAGVTPHAYALAHRTRQLRHHLHRDCTVTEAIFEAGYGSNSRFYENSERTLGMTPSRFRSGGTGIEIRFALGICSLGSILVASTAAGICAISLSDDPEILIREFQDRFPQAKLIGNDGEYEQYIAQVVGFVDAPHTGLGLPLDIRGTAFQQRVWQALCEIPPGSTASYAEIAARIGAPKAVRAVASACAANRLAVAIPCHRVVRSDGALSGYRWGIARKRMLLEKEAHEHALAVRSGE